MINIKKLLISTLLINLFLPVAVFAHPGRTDSAGCHTCRTNCSSWGLSTGEYHCHRAKALSQPLEPIKSHKVKGGTGYTTPAPEYKNPAINKNVNTLQTQTATNNKVNVWSKMLSWFGWR